MHCWSVYTYFFFKGQSQKVWDKKASSYFCYGGQCFGKVWTGITPLSVSMSIFPVHTFIKHWPPQQKYELGSSYPILLWSHTFVPSKLHCRVWPKPAFNCDIAQNTLVGLLNLFSTQNCTNQFKITWENLTKTSFQCDVITVFSKIKAPLK